MYCVQHSIHSFLISAGLTEVFTHPQERQIVNGPPLTTLPVLGVQWSVAFKIKLSNFAGYSHCLNLIGESSEVINIMLTSGNKFRLMFGYPFLKPSTNKIDDDTSMSLGVWTQIEIAQVQQGSTTNIIFMKNGDVVGTILNPQPLNVFGVDLFAVKTGVKAQPGTVKELAIRTDLSGNNIS